MYVVFANSTNVLLESRVRRWKFIKQNNHQKDCYYCDVNGACVHAEGINMLTYNVCESCWLDISQHHNAVPITPQEASGVFLNDR